MAQDKGGHAAQMDAIYRGQRHIYDLTRKYYLLGRDRLIARLSPEKGGSVLEIGCGTGRNLIVAARRYPDAHFYGLDISEEMLVSARQSIAKAGLSDRITVAQGDATCFDVKAMFGLDGVDTAYFSYTLSMVPDWKAAIGQGVKALVPGGTLHMVDFGQQEKLPRWFGAMLFAWLRKFHVTPRAELPAVVERIAAEQGATARFDALYRGYAWAAEIHKAG